MLCRDILLTGLNRLQKYNCDSRFVLTLFTGSELDTATLNNKKGRRMGALFLCKLY